jgi:spore coat protein U-like protein
MRLIACTVLLAVAASASFAATRCQFKSVVPVIFGAYDVFSTAPNDNGVGSITIDCGGAGNTVFVVRLDAGGSHNYTARAMTHGGDSLNYNLYTDAARSNIWSDNHGSGQTATFTKNKPYTMNIFGRIPPGQDVAVGTYTENIVATVNF